LHGEKYDIIDIDHDGNCFYKAFSLAKYDNQEQYESFKLDLVHLINNTDKFK